MTEVLELTGNQGNELAWILDFVCDPRNRIFSPTSWPERMRPLLDQLHDKGYSERTSLSYPPHPRIIHESNQ